MNEINKSSSMLTWRVVVQVFVVAFVLPLIPVPISGRWGWPEAWAFGLVSGFGFVVSRLLAARRNPDIITERARAMNHRDIKPWDKILAPLTALGLFGVLIVAGFDQRFMIRPAIFPPLFRWTALAMIAGGYALGSWALIENRFFSGVVRIQSERGHQVVSTGPYRIVRHPGYAGALPSNLLTPVLLDSLWAFIPALVATIALIVRTSLEDRTLQKELPGYAEYTQRTRYRLLPGMW